MKFLHSGDWHLGRPFVGLGTKGSKLRDAQMSTVKEIIGVASAEEVDAMVIAGDAFDSNEVSGLLVKRVVSLLESLHPIPVFVLPGTHDVLDETCVYYRREFREAGNIHVFGIDGTSFEVGDAAIHGRANDSKRGGIRPLKELKPNPEVAVNIAVVHASLAIPSKSSSDDYLVTPQDIAGSGMDYAALGHWHKAAEFSSAGVSAWYSGSPEPLKFDEGNGAGNVLLVEVGDGKTVVVPRHVGHFSWLEKSIDVSKFPPGDSLDSEILASAGDKTLLKVSLKGVLPPGTDIDYAYIEESLSEEFFHLQIDASRVGFHLEDLDNLFVAGTVGSLYVQQIRQQIRKAKKPEEKALLEEGLYRGAGYLSGDLEVV